MTKISIIVLLYLIPIDGHRLIKTKVTNDITVSIADELMPMTPEDIAQRHPSVRAPLGAYTDENRMIDFSIKTSATQWPDVDLEMSKQFFKSGIYNLYDRVTMIDEGIRDIHKKEYIFFEFESRINGDRRDMGNSDAIQKYTYILYLVEKSRTLVISFSCPQQMQGEWQETARAMMNSLRIR
ncbi:MAG TPA: hypothetical protein PKJ63_12525 [Cyclobacteriaceae bacterium]|mgnify:CR=1 FL=1|nr:hypothetical protein [Cyclobacteriaceae bacterium]HRX00118.1 hypothetical protein [Cyclobacteriaceae bacterium]